MERPQREDFKARLEISEHKRVLLQKRLSRGGIEEDLTVWSFVDLMTLLLILFILFYSHAVTHKSSAGNPENTQTKSAAAPSLEVHKTSMVTETAAYDPDQRQPDSVKPDSVKTVEENPNEALEQFEQEVLQTVSDKVKKDFSVHWNQKRLVLVLGERIAFNVGQADLLPDFQPTLKQIAEFISSQKEYNVTVAGHTDDTPIHNPQFPSNWELSAIRAVNVAKFMISNGVNPHRISTEGYSAYRPLHPNTTAQNRHTNRRVEITLIKENEKSAEQVEVSSAPSDSMKPTRTANLPVYPQKRHYNSRGYLF